MKVYVAANFAEKVRARQLMAALRAAGHEITHDWTHESVAGKTGAELRKYLGDCAADDLDGVEDCDYFVLLCHPTKAEGTGGAATELGVALALGKLIIAVPGASVNIFLHLVSQVASDEAVLEQLAEAVVRMRSAP